MLEGLRLGGVILIIALVTWCALSLGADVGHASFTPLLRSWGSATLAILMSLSNYLLRIIRWRLYLYRLGHALTFPFAALTYLAGFAFTLSPGKIGELVRAKYYAEKGIPLRDVAAAFCAERLMDLAGLLVLGALILSADPEYKRCISISAGIVTCAALFAITLPWRALGTFLQSSSQHQSRFLRACATASSFVVGARSLLQPRTMALGFPIALVAWGLEGAGLGVLGSIFVPGLIGARTAMGIYSVAVLVGTLSFLPGGLGSTEAVMTALLVSKGFPVSNALFTTISCRIVTLWLGVCVGWLAVVALRYWPMQGSVVTSR